jgi:hypothetical protein
MTATLTPKAPTGRMAQLGSYQTPAGRRVLLALRRGPHLRVVDRLATAPRVAESDERVVEPFLSGLREAQALAADYLAVAEAPSDFWPAEGPLMPRPRD